ncbi:hypothetical protein HMPREF1545_00747 [Oscillibacter sp. KLE 1728]|nr:hypothetical protein HMPREF1545_00747 [Oscillibacter sp. KLE 1728]ERK67419.1 hypothetical protein HMPREF1546_00451 [Oscillibacter sp. KLE 1745]
MSQGKAQKNHSKRIFDHIQKMNGIELFSGKKTGKVQHKGKI